MGQKKNWTAEEKLAIVLDGFKGRGVREICCEYGVSESQYYKWRDNALQSLKEGLKDKRRKGSNNGRPAEAERKRLLKIIGEQQLIIDIQKKFQKRFNQ